MKRVLKFGTGESIPEGAIYMTTLFQTFETLEGQERLVWHYFLVEVGENG